jgi:hypothetical protein
MSESKWTPSPNDAMAMAAIRWFACVIETYSIELYASNPSTFEHTEKILRATLKELGMQKDRQRLARLADEDCPTGYLLCDGLCKPACDLEASTVKGK